MPGGDSDKGLGANKNEIYLSLENSTQYIDWWHEPVPGEDFDHAGSLLTTVFRPGAIYGISNKLNLYLFLFFMIKKTFFEFSISCFI